MAKALFKVPLSRWIRTTLERMNAAGLDDFDSWSNFWLLTYKDLGGKSDNSGSKECPKHAAYGLWRLGRITNSGQVFQNWTLEKINLEFGKNAAYAILALELLEKQHGEVYIEDNWSKAELWLKVQDLYKQKLRISPAESEQGAIRIASCLFTEGQIVTISQ